MLLAVHSPELHFPVQPAGSLLHNCSAVLAVHAPRSVEFDGPWERALDTLRPVLRPSRSRKHDEALKSRSGKTTNLRRKTLNQVFANVEILGRVHVGLLVLPGCLETLMIVSKIVKNRPFVGIANNLVGGSNVCKALRSHCVALIAVRVILHAELLVDTSNFGLGSVSRDLENCVRVFQIADVWLLSLSLLFFSLLFLSALFFLVLLLLTALLLLVLLLLLAALFLLALLLLSALLLLALLVLLAALFLLVLLLLRLLLHLLLLFLLLMLTALFFIELQLQALLITLLFFKLVLTQCRLLPPLLILEIPNLLLLEQDLLDCALLVLLLFLAADVGLNLHLLLVLKLLLKQFPVL
eukprot:m.723591 g.723591  ORF g.723591 m.723591 type:complete len:354 (-) comp58828_c0_seq59:259-1320(-)